MANEGTVASLDGSPPKGLPGLNFKAIFEAYPCPGIVLSTAAKFPILAANDSYLETTGNAREDLLGRGFFEVFPGAAEAAGDSFMEDSFTRVIRDKEPDVMGIRKYNSPRREGAGLQYWIPVNVPVVEAGGEVAYIIHKILDVTEFVARPGRPLPPARAEAVPTEALVAEISLRSSELKRVKSRLQAALERQEDREAELGRLRDRLRGMDRVQSDRHARLIPICAWCQKVRNEQAVWEGLAEYASHHLGVAWTHGICPECRSKVFWNPAERG